MENILSWISIALSVAGAILGWNMLTAYAGLVLLLAFVFALASHNESRRRRGNGAVK